MSHYSRRTHQPDAGGWLAYLPAGVPAALRTWLREEQSLTQRVHACCDDLSPFSLRLLRHDHALPLSDERALLRQHGVNVRVREVLLKRGNVPLVFAHSVVALRDLRGPWASMDGIGGRSLGSILFADHQVERGTLHYRRIDVRHPLFHKARRWCGDFSVTDLWARRAVFHRRGRPLIVTEVFLPAILSI